MFAHSGVQRILCPVFVLFFFVLCTLCCQFLWIVHFWLPLRCYLTFISDHTIHNINHTKEQNLGNHKSYKNVAPCLTDEVRVSPCWTFYYSFILFVSVFFNQMNCIDGLNVSILAVSAVVPGFEPQSGQSKDYDSGICCFFDKHISLRTTKRFETKLGQNFPTLYIHSRLIRLVSIISKIVFELLLRCF